MKYCLSLVLLMVPLQLMALDLDRKEIPVAYMQFPEQPINNPEHRRVSYSLGASFRPRLTEHKINELLFIEGFSLSEENPGVRIDFDFGPLFVKHTEVEVIEREYTDKKKVKRIKYSYRPIIEFSTSARVEVSAINGFEKSYRFGKSNNRFVGEKTSSRRSANNFFTANIFEVKDSLYIDFIEQVLMEVNAEMNQLFGYVPVQKNENAFLLMDSKKYPEYSDYRSIYADLKTIFSKMTPYDSVEPLKAEVQPIIRFLEGIVPRYPKNSRAHRKMRYASLYNIAQIYFYLDDFENAERYFLKVIENDYREGDSKRMLDEIIRLRQVLVRNQVNTRHLAYEQAQHSAKQPNTAVRYIGAEIELKDREIIEGKIELPDTSTDPIEAIQMASVLVVKFLNNNDEIEERHIRTLNINWVKLSDQILQSISYRTDATISDGPRQEVSRGKVGLGPRITVLARQLYSSPKISLLSYRNELILKKPDEAEGVSTATTAFDFGFKKKLSDYFSDCRSMQRKIADGAYANDSAGLSMAAEDYNSCRLR